MAGWSAYQNIILPETRKNRVTRALEDMQRPEPIERGGSSYGQQQYGKPVSTFWTNPTNVAQYYSLANSYDAKPDWMDDAFVDFINQAYAGFEMANQTATWQDWKPLQPDDQFNQFLQSFAAPPTGFEAPALEEQQPYPTVQDPGYLTGGLTEEQWDALPWYQQWAYQIFSSPKSAGAAIGTVAGIAGGPAGMVAGAGLGAGLGAIGEKAPWLAGIMDTLDYLAEGAERFLGASSLLMTGEVDTFADLSAAWKAGHLTYDVARLMDEQVVDLLKPAQKVDWTDDELIYEAYDRIRRGENVDEVYASIQERTGFAGEMRDLMGHMIFDPLNLTPFVFGKVAKGGLKLGLTAAKALDKTGDIARAYKPLELALDASKGVVDAAQKWGSEIRVGAVEPQLLPKLDPISKWLGNITAEGISKDIVKAPEMTGFANVVNRVGGAAATGSVAAIVGAGIGGPFGALVTGGLGALYGGKKGLMYLTNLTPASRAYEVFDNTVRNITNVIPQADGDKALTI